MNNKIIECFPEPLLQDLIEGRWIPILGSGFSRNAITPPGKKMPLWDDLGLELSTEIKGFQYQKNPLETISTYSYIYKKPKLVEKLSELLLIKESYPGKVHEAFCKLPFDYVCTTNIEFLIEKQYENINRYIIPILNEEQFAINIPSAATALIKLHGDINHPEKLILTEEDYDLFINNNPILSTFISSLLITRTPVLIGYSLDDPDFRQLWQLIRDRLGTYHRAAYTFLIEPDQYKIEKHRRRGITVITLPGKKEEYSNILEETFNSLHEYWINNLISKTKITKEGPIREFLLPYEKTNRLCYFAVSYALLPFYREYIFPIAERYGMIPIIPEEFVYMGYNKWALNEALMEKSFSIVVDVSDKSTYHELNLALTKGKGNRLLVVLPEELPFSINLRGLRRLIRPINPYINEELWNNLLIEWFESISKKIIDDLEDEPNRLFRKREYRSAVISSINKLETTLKKKVDMDIDEKVPLWKLIKKRQYFDYIEEPWFGRIKECVHIRNLAVHTNQMISRDNANYVINTVNEFIEALKNNEYF